MFLHCSSVEERKRRNIDSRREKKRFIRAPFENNERVNGNLASRTAPPRGHMASCSTHSRCLGALPRVFLFNRTYFFFLSGNKEETYNHFLRSSPNQVAWAAAVCWPHGTDGSFNRRQKTRNVLFYMYKLNNSLRLTLIF